MEKVAKCIRRIEITSLWNGRKHIVWNLRPDVNILSGVNGVGKSTILNKLIHSLNRSRYNGDAESALDVKIDFDPSDADTIRFDLVRSFDRPVAHGDVLEKIAEGKIATELDFQLYQLQRRFLDYQVNLGNRMIEMLASDDARAREEAAAVAGNKKRFQDIVDNLFFETGKRIDRKSNEVRFLQYDEVLSPYLLSSGEKQILIILLTVLVEDCRPYVFFMDEPEASLHIEWQEKLISLIRRLNPNVQIILTTHSPAVAMDGWLDAVTEVTDITQ